MTVSIGGCCRRQLNRRLLLSPSTGWWRGEGEVYRSYWGLVLTQGRLFGSSTAPCVALSPTPYRPDRAAHRGSPGSIRGGYAELSKTAGGGGFDILGFLLFRFPFVSPLFDLPPFFPSFSLHLHSNTGQAGVNPGRGFFCDFSPNSYKSLLGKDLRPKNPVDRFARKFSGSTED